MVPCSDEGTLPPMIPGSYGKPVSRHAGEHSFSPLVKKQFPSPISGHGSSTTRGILAKPNDDDNDDDDDNNNKKQP